MLMSAWICHRTIAAGLHKLCHQRGTTDWIPVEQAPLRLHPLAQLEDEHTAIGLRLLEVHEPLLFDDLPGLRSAMLPRRSDCAVVKFIQDVQQVEKACPMLCSFLSQKGSAMWASMCLQVSKAVCL